MSTVAAGGLLCDVSLASVDLAVVPGVLYRSGRRKTADGEPEVPEVAVRCSLVCCCTQSLTGEALRVYWCLVGEVCGLVCRCLVNRPGT